MVGTRLLGYFWSIQANNLLHKEKANWIVDSFKNYMLYAYLTSDYIRFFNEYFEDQGRKIDLFRILAAVFDAEFSIYANRFHIPNPEDETADIITMSKSMGPIIRTKISIKAELGVLIDVFVTDLNLLLMEYLDRISFEMIKDIYRILLILYDPVYEQIFLRKKKLCIKKLYSKYMQFRDQLAGILRSIQV